MKKVKNPSTKSRVDKLIGLIQNDKVSLNRFQMLFKEWIADPKNLAAFSKKFGIKRLDKHEKV